jgi:formate dehydrogenase subunit gamma
MSTHEAKEGGERMFVRFNLSQRLEHIVQIIGFLALCVTGIPQRYNGAAWADSAIHAMGGIDVVRGIHRTFGGVLVAETVYHVGGVLYVMLFRRARWSMLPGMQDLRDAVQMVLFFVGKRKERARFDRFDFRQKVEYLALLWGTAVMIATGLCMWFPIQVTAWLPGELIPAAKAAHGGEGLLAFASILMWHMYSAHLSPDVFPFDMTMFTGKISEERMKHEHPLEYERIIAAERAQAAAAAPPPAPTPERERAGLGSEFAVSPAPLRARLGSRGINRQDTKGAKGSRKTSVSLASFAPWRFVVFVPRRVRLFCSTSSR